MRIKNRKIAFLIIKSTGNNKFHVMQLCKNNWLKLLSRVTLGFNKGESLIRVKYVRIPTLEIILIPQHRHVNVPRLSLKSKKILLINWSAGTIGTG
jgi:hypothetical protein